jgi:hypothetical protein
MTSISNALNHGNGGSSGSKGSLLGSAIMPLGKTDAACYSSVTEETHGHFASQGRPETRTGPAYAETEFEPLP